MTGETDKMLNPETNLAARRNKIPCQIFSRVCGYYQPTFTWNIGKQAEFEERADYNIGGFLDEKPAR